MKLHYYPETDSLYIELSSAPGAEIREIVDGLVVDLDADGNVGFDIDNASGEARPVARRNHLATRRPRRGVRLHKQV